MIHKQQQECLCIPAVTKQDGLLFFQKGHDVFHHTGSHCKLGICLFPEPEAQGNGKIGDQPFVPYQDAEHQAGETVTIQIVGVIMGYMGKKFWHILKLFSQLCYHHVIYTKKNRLVFQGIENEFHRKEGSNGQKSGLICIGIGTGIVKGIQRFFCYPHQKKLVKKTDGMKDSQTMTDSITRKSVYAVRAVLCSK